MSVATDTNSGVDNLQTRFDEMLTKLVNADAQIEDLKARRIWDGCISFAYLTLVYTLFVICCQAAQGPTTHTPDLSLRPFLSNSPT